MSVTVSLAVATALFGVPTPPVDCLVSPVSAPIVERFVAPVCDYCAGHRTVDFAGHIGTTVLAPATGIVTFSGDVAGASFVTIGLGEGSRPDILVTLGGVTALAGIGTLTGSRVVAGRAFATATEGRVRMSVRILVAGSEARYVDPEPSIARWRAPLRLVPDPETRLQARRRVQPRWSCIRPLTMTSFGTPVSHRTPDPSAVSRGD